jgi:hypothetical protein
MAKWRNIHINEEEWNWTRSKTKPAVVIREPNKGKIHTILFEDLEADVCLITNDVHIIPSITTPSIIKKYIERNLIGEKKGS